MAVSVKDTNLIEIYEVGDIKEAGNWKKIWTLSREV